MGDALLGALALMLVFEGLLPLINPRGWRSVFERVLQMNDGQIRFIGLFSVGLGLLLLLIWR
ncbi:MAG: DUF2065 domain-containing protein [Burkholderiaceae bacterium]|uniref:DUF2065 domain-containing protein n=1 Tax=Rubrivivax albus TaxID=2499835 RepID=A0A437K1K9_9BURK|nr:DUF2065 domain-containing protein [Rubrivivax albus]MCP5272210.1 DUF2065 domain-containing protein [Burkholderiaceae bacterium]RVT54180.1 DUF2065 domain-containing protein [Rubrivivax albus]